MDRISLVIVTYNSSQHIYSCIDSILSNNDIGDNLEIIIVDNASTEQESMFKGLKEHYGRRIILQDSRINGGYGYGNNIGINKATSDIVIVMNPDVRLVHPIFGEIIKIIKNDCSIGILGVSFIDGSLPFYVKPERTNILNQLIHPIRVKLKCYNERKMYMSGSFLAFKKDVFQKAGSFDENIFMYTEEPDITNRIQMLGYHAVWCPNLYVRHLAHGRAFNKSTENLMMQSLKYYFKKYNADLKKNIRTKIKVLGIKKIVATIVNNKTKIRLFKERSQYLESVLKSL